MKAYNVRRLARVIRIGSGVFVCCTFLLFIILVGCSRKADKTEDQTITMGSILVLSGPNAHYGEDTKAGMEEALEYVNKEGISFTGPDGKVHNFKLNINFKNSYGGPNNTLNASEQMIGLINADYPAILGGFFSGTTLGLAPIANDKKVVLLTPCSTNYKLREAGPWVFRILPTDYDQAVRMADYAKSTLKADKAGVLYIKNPYGEDLANTFVNHFESAGGSVPYKRSFNENTTEFAGFIYNLLGSDAQFLFLVGHTQEMIDILKTKYKKEQQKKSRPLPVLGTDGMYDTTFITQAGKGAEGIVLASAGFNPQADDPVVKRFVTSFKEKYGHEPNLWSAGGYDAVLVIAEAIRKGGETSAGIRQALMQIRNLPGATGINTVDETGGMRGKTVFTFVVRGEKFETLQ